ncbi:MAG: hypothetical protein Q9191_000847 [Dirinaria sp. TL-2023a]
MATDENEASQFSHVFAYDWEADEEFQDGLRTILDLNASPEQAADLTLQAKCFYYSRKFNVTIEPSAYQSWVRRSAKNEHIPSETGDKPVLSSFNASDSVPSVNAPAIDAEPAAPYPNSFGQIVELITQGKPIPGVKEVPNTLLTGQETQPTLPKRKKPWEQEGGEEAANGGGSKNHMAAI